MVQMTNKILAIIPARGGSKGLPRKNILDLAGKPLIAWTIEASLSSKYITKTLVSSDDEEILNVSQQYKSDIIKRPYELSTDTASSESVIRHALNELKKENQEFDYVILLQPTSPLRDVKDIDNAFNALLDSNATALISVYEINNKILKAFIQDESGYIKGISNNQYPFMRRQDLPTTYLSNGAIYIISVKEFMKNNSFLTNTAIAYKMDEAASIDIDTITDLDEIERIINAKASI